MLAALFRQLLPDRRLYINCGMLQALQTLTRQDGSYWQKKMAPEELKPFQGLMLGIYQPGVSPAWINPASPGWPAVVVKALPAGRPR